MFRHMKINWHFLPLKLHYFLWNLGTGPVLPFLSIYARQIGFSSVVVGLIYTIVPIFGLITKPIVGAISDKFKCHKISFIAAQLLTAITFLCIFYSPQIETLREVDFKCDLSGLKLTSLNNESVNECSITQLQETGNNVNCNLDCDIGPKDWGLFCDNIIKWGIPNVDCTHPQTTYALNPVISTKNISTSEDSRLILDFNRISLKGHADLYPLSCPLDNPSLKCTLECDDYNINNMLATPKINNDDAYHMYQFWIFLIFMIFNWMGQATVMSMGDSICFQMLGKEPEKFGYQRMWGALGWGIITPLTGIIVDRMSRNHSSKNYIAAFYIAPAFILLDAFVSNRLKHKQTKVSKGILKDVGKLLKKPRILIYLLWCIFMGMCTAIMWSFLLWLIEDLARAQGCGSQVWLQTLEGLVMGIQCLGGEMPFFFMSGWILKKIGHVNAMSLVLGVVGIRYVLYSVITNPWWFLPIEFSQGITFGLFYATMTSYASIVTPPGTDATMQGLVSSAFEGLGASLGGFTAGMLFNKVGGSLTFRYFGFGAIGASLLHIIAQYFLRRTSKSTTRSEQIADDSSDSGGF